MFAVRTSKLEESWKHVPGFAANLQKRTSLVKILFVERIFEALY